MMIKNLQPKMISKNTHLSPDPSNPQPPMATVHKKILKANPKMIKSIPFPSKLSNSNQKSNSLKKTAKKYDLNSKSVMDQVNPIRSEAIQTRAKPSKSSKY
jgi:hypothetical protein